MLRRTLIAIICLIIIYQIYLNCKSTVDIKEDTDIEVIQPQETAQPDNIQQVDGDIVTPKQNTILAT